MYVIVGLGNPDKKYEHTRHNIGFDVIDALADKYNISVTDKKHNTNINRKLGVTSREELMLYIDLFRRCGRLDEIAAPRAEDTARCTT